MKIKPQYQNQGMHRNKKDSRGFVLFVAYLLMMTLSIVSLGLFNRGSVFVQSAERNKKKVVAFNMAEAGFDNAFWQIKNNQIANYPWTSGYIALDTGNIRGGYNVTVTDMGNNIKRIQAVGYSPSQNVALESQEVRPITGYVQLQVPTAFNFGIFAKENIQMNGNAVVDSYDSRVGPYRADNAGSKGDLGTDSIATGTVRMSGNVHVKGGVTVGPQGVPDSVIRTSGNVVITGNRTAATRAQNPPDPTTSASSEGALTVNGNTIYYLSAGTHRFTSLSITGNGQVVPRGPVSVYVEGTVHIAGNGIATVGDIPPNFLLYSLGNSRVQLSGNGNFYGGIYAPNSEVKNTGNGKIFGAMVSKTYHQSGNGEIHFDEAMKQIGGTGGNNLTLLSWQENNIMAQSTSSPT